LFNLKSKGKYKEVLMQMSNLGVGKGFPQRMPVEERRVEDEGKSPVKESRALASNDKPKIAPESSLPDLFKHELKFVINNETHHVIVEVIDKKTRKVVRELPPKELRWFMGENHLPTGGLVDKKV
jgi:flagellar protein FlaG